MSEWKKPTEELPDKESQLIIIYRSETGFLFKSIAKYHIKQKIFLADICCWYKPEAIIAWMYIPEYVEGE